MLVISRRKGERINIGNDIEIIVTEVHRSSCKIAIRAPEGTIITRSEITNRHTVRLTDDVLNDLFKKK
jgi:carbon storage regulator